MARGNGSARFDLSGGAWMDVRKLRWRDEVAVRRMLGEPPDGDASAWNMDYNAACVAACVTGHGGWGDGIGAKEAVELLSIVEFARIRAAVFEEADGLKNSQASSPPATGG